MRSVMPAIAIEVADPVSETFQSGVTESLERQNRFVADNLRRIFVQTVSELSGTKRTRKT